MVGAMKKRKNISSPLLGLIKRKEAIELLGIPEKDFKNYHEFSREIEGRKIGAYWYFNEEDLLDWKSLKDKRTVRLTLEQYERCFEFAIKMVYGGLSLHGIRGERTEVQAADDVILGILAEHAIKQFLNERFSVDIMLDEAVHPEEITPQDFDLIKDGGNFRKPRMGVGVKASKMKNAYLVLGSKEVELPKRKSDVYIFARVGLPGDHLFRILREHSFFGKVREFFDKNDNFKKIDSLKDIPVWICGFCYVEELEKVTKIPGQEFQKGYRYVKSVKNLHNSDEDWESLIKKL
jgi:hypothetical protein